MCDKAVDNYSHALVFLPNCYKSQKISNKAVGIYPSAIQFVLECLLDARNVCKAADTCPFLFDSVPDWYMTDILLKKCVIKVFPKNLLC